MILLQNIRESIDGLQFSLDGRMLAAPCSGAVQVWSDVAAGGSPRLLHYSSVASVRFTPDGRKLLLDGHPNRVYIHDWETGEAVAIPLEFSFAGGSCDLTPDGRFVVACQTHTGMEPPARLFCRSVNDPAALAWSVASTRRIYSRPLFLAGGERFVVFEGQPNAIPFWYVTRDARAGQVLAQVMGSGYHFHSPVLSADGRLIAARWGTWLAVFRADDFAAGPVTLRNDNRKQFTGLAFHPSGRFLAATSNDATVKLYDTTTWKVVVAFDWEIGRLRSVAFSPDGMLAAAGGDRGKIVVWDVDL